MEIHAVQYRFVSACLNKLFLLLFSILLLGCPPLFTTYALAEKAQQFSTVNEEKIKSVLQAGIGLIKQEIQRDQAIVSVGIRLSRDIREVRKTLKNGIASKEQLISDLQLWLPSRLPAEIDALQKTLDQEKEIVDNFITSSRIRRLTHEIIEESIPVKEEILATFEQVLSELRQSSP